jgi:hypothetical protein
MVGRSDRSRKRGSARWWTAAAWRVASTLVASVVAPRPAYAGAVPHHCTNPVQILAFGNNELVSAEQGYPGTLWGMLRARTIGAAGSWERFQFCKLNGYSNTQFAIRSLASGKWVSTEVFAKVPDDNMLRARADSIGDWEVFTSDQFDSYTEFPRGINFHFASSFVGNEVTAEVGGPAPYDGYRYGELRASTLYGHVGPWEYFSIYDTA